jgi:hypothetical protein
VNFETLIDKTVRIILDYFPNKGKTTIVQATEHLYIVKDDNILSGEPIIKGTCTPVRAIVETWRMGILLKKSQMVCHI